MGRQPILFVFGIVLAFALGWTGSVDATASSFITDIQTANVVDTSFTVSWVTGSAIPGSGVVRYGVDPANLTNDVSEGPPPAGARGDIHSVFVPNLAPSTSYYYLVMNGSYRDDNSCHLYKVTTGPTISTSTAVHSASGQVVLADGHTAASGVLVTLRILDYSGQNGTAGPVWSAYLSTLTNPQGQWTLSPFNPRTVDASAIFNYPSTGDTLLYTVYGGGFGDSGTLSQALTFDSANHLAVSQVLLGAVVPTETPSANQATATSGCVPTNTPAAPTGTATSTPEIATVVPTATIGIVPTVAPSVAVPANPAEGAPVAALPTPTLMGDNLEQAVGPTPVPPVSIAPPSPTARLLPSPPPVTAPSTVPVAPAPSPTASPLVAPVVARSTPDVGRSVSTATTRKLTPSPSATTLPEPTSGPPSSASTTNDGPLSHATGLFLASLGLVGIGLVVAAVGIVGQLREP